jgi:hypothetical protein
MTHDALSQQSQDNLIQFLRTDLELSRTFLETASIASEREHYQKLLQTVRRAIETIRNLSGRVQDPAILAAILAKADAVEDDLLAMPDGERLAG